MLITTATIVVTVMYGVFASKVKNHTVQNMASGLLPFEKKTLRQAKTPDNVVTTNPAIGM
jgi:hypothetical protein